MLWRGNSNAEALSQTVIWLSSPGQIDLVQAAVEYESSLWSIEERKKKVFGDYPTTTAGRDLLTTVTKVTL